jgi:hypothetical protein
MIVAATTLVVLSGGRHGLRQHTPDGELCCEQQAKRTTSRDQVHFRSIRIKVRSDAIVMKHTAATAVANANLHRHRVRIEGVIRGQCGAGDAPFQPASRQLVSMTDSMLDQSAQRKLRARPVGA